MAKKIFFELLEYDVKAWYTVDVFNQRLTVGICPGLDKSLHHLFIKEVELEAYDHYNRANKDAQFIHPSGIVN